MSHLSSAGNKDTQQINREGGPLTYPVIRRSCKMLPFKLHVGGSVPTPDGPASQPSQAWAPLAPTHTTWARSNKNRDEAAASHPGCLSSRSSESTERGGQSVKIQRGGHKLLKVAGIPFFLTSSTTCSHASYISATLKRFSRKFIICPLASILTHVLFPLLECPYPYKVSAHRDLMQITCSPQSLP